MLQASSSIGRAAVSKTAGWGFDSLLACHLQHRFKIGKMADSIKFSFALILTAVSIGGFYYFGDQSLLLRVIGLLVMASVVAAIALQTQAGKAAWAFIGDSKMEVRKVVWPTMKETRQTTLIVMAMVVVIAIILWLVDIFFMWAVQTLTGLGG